MAQRVEKYLAEQRRLAELPVTNGSSSRGRLDIFVILLDNRSITRAQPWSGHLRNPNKSRNEIATRCNGSARVPSIGQRPSHSTTDWSRSAQRLWSVRRGYPLQWSRNDNRRARACDSCQAADRKIGTDHFSHGVREAFPVKYRVVEPPQRLFLDPSCQRVVPASPMEMPDQLLDHGSTGKLIARLGIPRRTTGTDARAQHDKRFEEQVLVALARADVARLAARERQVERVRPVNGRKRPSPSPHRKTTRNGSDLISRRGETTTPSAR